jgi:PadR family transcriptional regulator, regulatory protein PadR
MLAEFEYLILSAAARLREAAYGAAIRQEIEEASRQRCSIGALYTMLDRLETKGLIKTWMGDPTPQRGADRSAWCVLRQMVSVQRAIFTSL